MVCFLAACCLSLPFITGCGGSSTTGAPPPAQTQAPAVSSLSPSTIAADSGAFTLTVAGSGFASGSQVTWNGTPLPTTFVSATQLTAAVSASLAATGGSPAIAVVNPGGQSSTSTPSATLTIDNPVPTVAQLSPAVLPAGSPSTSVIVTGTNFVAGSTASLGGAPLPTTVQSATQLTAALSAANLANPGSAPLVVTNPAPGGGASAAVAFVVGVPGAPALSAVSPSSALAGSAELPVTITGTGFTQGLYLTAGGYPLNAQYVSATSLTAALPAQLLATAAPLSLTLQDSNGRSNTLQFPVLNPAPVLTSLSPATVTAGSVSFTLTLTGSGLNSSSQLLVNGSPRPFVGMNAPNTATVAITATDVAQPGKLSIGIANPAPGGGTSATLQLTALSGNTLLRSVPLPANALAWDATHGRIYAAIASTAPSQANSVVAVDPASGSVTGSAPMPGQPTLLSITGDGQYLYVAMPEIAQIARLKLPALTPDIHWSTGTPPKTGSTFAITDLQTAPGAPHTVAVAQNQGSSGNIELAIYDDGVLRPQTPFADANSTHAASYLQWGPSSLNIIYGANRNVSGGTALLFTVSSSGATLSQAAAGVFGDFSPILYDPASALLYDGYGSVSDPATGRAVGGYPLLGTISYEPSTFAVDSALNRVFFLNNSPYPISPNYGTGTQIQVFDQKHYTYIDSIYLPSVTTNGAKAQNLIRWGNAGLAFTLENAIYLLDGPFVAPGVAASSTTGSYVVPAPTLTSLSPETVPAGAPDTLVTLTGTNFTGSTTVRWNGNTLAATLIGPTQMQVTLPAASLSNPAAGPILATGDPQAAPSNPLAFTVLPDLGSGMRLAAIGISGSDLAWNSAAGLLYEAVPAGDLVHGDTIASIDPVAGALKSTLPVSGSPGLLAISADNQYLYAGFGTSAAIQRFQLPALTADLSIPLGGIGSQSTAPGTRLSCDFPLSIAVAPGAPATLAVTEGNGGYDPAGCGGVIVYDNATARANPLPSSTTAPIDLYSLAWGADSTHLYAQSQHGFTRQYIASLQVAPSSVTLEHSFENDLGLGSRVHFDLGTGYLYSDGGDVTRPSDGTVLGSFKASGLMVPDSALGRAYFLGQTTDQTTASQNSSSYTLQVYDLTHYTLLNSIVIPNVIGLPVQLVRWGSNGLAFTTGGGDYEGGNAPGLTYLVSGPAIDGSAAAGAIPDMAAPHVQLTWHLHRANGGQPLQHNP